jgi:hypothetical protein
VQRALTGGCEWSGARRVWRQVACRRRDPAVPSRAHTFGPHTAPPAHLERCARARTHAPPPPRARRQIHASAEALRLITFDADGTLYADGHHFEHDNEMIQLFITLMKVRFLAVCVCARAATAGVHAHALPEGTQLHCWTLLTGAAPVPFVACPAAHNTPTTTRLHAHTHTHTPCARRVDR